MNLMKGANNLEQPLLNEAVLELYIRTYSFLYIKRRGKSEVNAI
jgi:hypothetical protein